MALEHRLSLRRKNEDWSRLQTLVYYISNMLKIYGLSGLYSTDYRMCEMCWCFDETLRVYEIARRYKYMCHYCKQCKHLNIQYIHTYIEVVISLYCSLDTNDFAVLYLFSYYKSCFLYIILGCYSIKNTYFNTNKKKCLLSCVPRRISSFNKRIGYEIRSCWLSTLAWIMCEIRKQNLI